ncbi:DUF5455 family protein [Zobellella denitrificans]|uniref:DUF5455 family protein n=1 Tax=Zobellella denitrificans TaxID=347534 RepID=UPI0012FD2C2C|nr:DUF5455 family protein [Zobellella denitrificans]
MGALFAAIGNFVAAIIIKLVALIPSRAALAGAFIATFAAFTATFTLAINGLINPLISDAPSGSLFAAGMSLLPPNASFCLSAIASGYLLRWVFLWQYKTLSIVLRSK